MLVPGLVFGAVAVSVTGAFLGLRARNSKIEQVYYFRCPGCTQKLRYLASKAGRAGMCPRCRQRWTFPSNPEAFPLSSQACDDYQVRVGQRRAPARSAMRLPVRRAS
jgi:hypothetical protein